MTTSTSLCVMQHRAGDERLAEYGHLCKHHRHRLTKTLAEVRDLWVDLQFIDQPGTAPKDDTPKTKYTKASEAPAPANLTALALRDARSASVRFPDTPEKQGDLSTPIPSVVAIVASWTLLLAEERPLTATLPSSTIAQINLLIRHHDWISAQDWIDDYLREFTELRKALSGALNDHTHKRIGLCQLPTDSADQPVCGGTLVQENGSDVIRCVECSAAWVTPRERALLAVSLETA